MHILKKTKQVEYSLYISEEGFEDDKKLHNLIIGGSMYIIHLDEADFVKFQSYCIENNYSFDFLGKTNSNKYQIYCLQDVYNKFCLDNSDKK